MLKRTVGEVWNIYLSLKNFSSFCLCAEKVKAGFDHELSVSTME